MCVALLLTRTACSPRVSFRTDAQHFISKYHPDVPCPICNEEFAVYEVNAHVTICLDTPKQPTPSKPDRDSHMEDQANVATSSKPTSSSPSLFGVGSFSSTPIAIPSLAGSLPAALPRRPRKVMGQRSASASQIHRLPAVDDNSDDDILSPPLGLDDEDAAADDEAEDDDEKQPGPSPTQTRSDTEEGKSTTLHRSNSDCSLSLAQAAAVANMVIKRKAANAKASAAAGSTGEKDPSLLDLLSTFSTLGFTRENLEEMHAKHISSTDLQ